MTIRRPALRVRDTVAAAILAALDDADRRAELDGLIALFADGSIQTTPAMSAPLVAAAIADPRASDETTIGLRAEVVAYAAPALARLRRGRDAAAAFWIRTAGAPGSAPLDVALGQSAALWSTGLFFEVHEVLERVWRGLDGNLRLFMQGLIQIAAALHHVETGNRAGARTLMGTGRAKLAVHATACVAVDAGELLRGIDAWLAAEQGGASLAALVPPQLTVRTASN